MFSLLRNRFGIPGVISVIALVFAMLGGAYAASNNGGGGKATASAKAKKGPPGPRGKTGPAGPAGPAGPQGLAGANGKDGAKGEKGDTGTSGTNGTPGTNGKSVKLTEIPVEEVECNEAGGYFVEVEGSGGAKEVCNGAKGEKGDKGEEGEEGSPWTAGGTLPPGATETGAWSFSAVPEQTKILAPISFTILLKEELEEGLGLVHFQSEPNFTDFDGVGPGTAGCKGTANLPKAPPGNLCVYYNTLGGAPQHATFSQIALLKSAEEGASVSGAILEFTNTATSGQLAIGRGDWAVTGCGNAAFPCP